jgi:hypothetical protein
MLFKNKQNRKLVSKHLLLSCMMMESQQLYIKNKRERERERERERNNHLAC